MFCAYPTGCSKHKEMQRPNKPAGQPQPRASLGCSTVRCLFHERNKHQFGGRQDQMARYGEKWHTPVFWKCKKEQQATVCTGRAYRQTSVVSAKWKSCMLTRTSFGHWEDWHFSLSHQKVLKSYNLLARVWRTDRVPLMHRLLRCRRTRATSQSLPESVRCVLNTVDVSPVNSKKIRTDVNFNLIQIT